MVAMTDSKCMACGIVFQVRLHDKNRGRGLFCGKSCARKGEFNPAYKHGNSLRQTGQTKEYQTWASIKSRVTNAHRQNSKYYVDKGVKMDDGWFNSFEKFLSDMGKAPSQGHSIDRIDNDGDYEPSNCRWATHQEQMNNTRQNVWLEYDGKRMTVEQWGRETGIKGGVISKRLKRGWTVERSLTEPRHGVK